MFIKEITFTSILNKEQTIINICRIQDKINYEMYNDNKIYSNIGIALKHIFGFKNFEKYNIINNIKNYEYN